MDSQISEARVIPASRYSVRQWIYVSLFCALIAVGAFIRIPVPVVPFTLQLLFTMLAGLLLGPKLGMLSVGLYIFLGLIGLPIFAEGGGIWYILKPSFGYLIGFAAGSYLTGKLSSNPQASFNQLLLANLAGLVVVYAFGLVYFYLMKNVVLGSPIGLWSLFVYGFILAVPGDIALCFLGASLAKRIRPLWRMNQ